MVITVKVILLGKRLCSNVGESLFLPLLSVYLSSSQNNAKFLLCNTQRKLVHSIDCSIMKITNIFVRTNKILHKIDKMAQC